MKCLTKQIECDALLFQGTHDEEIHEVQDWMSSCDIEDVECAMQGEYPEYALDITTEDGIIVAEPKSWLVIRAGKLTVETPESFEATYEII